MFYRYSPLSRRGQALKAITRRWQFWKEGVGLSELVLWLKASWDAPSGSVANLRLQRVMRLRETVMPLTRPRAADQRAARVETEKPVVYIETQIANTISERASERTVSPKYLRIYVRALRQKIEANPDQPCSILTEQGVGYRMRAPD
jgi:hypothetical protein